MREKVRFFFAVWSLGFREINIFCVLGKIWDVMVLGRKFIFCRFFLSRIMIQTVCQYSCTAEALEIFLRAGKRIKMYGNANVVAFLWDPARTGPQNITSGGQVANFEVKRIGVGLLYTCQIRDWDFSNTHTSLGQMYVQEMEVGGKINTLCSTHVRSIVDQFECNRRLPLLYFFPLLLPSRSLMEQIPISDN